MDAIQKMNTQPNAKPLVSRPNGRWYGWIAGGVLLLVNFGWFMLQEHARNPHARSLSRAEFAAHEKLADERNAQIRHELEEQTKKLDEILRRLPK